MYIRALSKLSNRLVNMRPKPWTPRTVMKWVSMELESQRAREPQPLNLTVYACLFRVCICRCLGGVETKLPQS